MSDELDQAAALEELERTITLANRKRPECCEDYQRNERAKQQRRVA